MTEQRAFQRALNGWYREHGRDLPWRRTRDPYTILVSEFMLQQTQVASMLPYYNKWLNRFPDFTTLARASENDVLHAWQGLGYYTRARNLHAAAKIVVHRHGSRFPKSIRQMCELPGVGKYTAHAVAAFSFDQSVPIIEANTARVLARIFNLRKPIDQTAGRQALWSYAAALLPKGSARIYNSALVDLGALVCLPRKPKCGICPVKEFCRATNPGILPVKKARLRTKQLAESHVFVVRQNRILLQQADRRWRGMWILPPLKFDGLKPLSSRRPVYKSMFPFTHHRVTLRVFREQHSHKIDTDDHRWFPASELDSIPIPSPHRRAIVDLLGRALDVER